MFPPKFDLFSLLMLLGIVQGFFLSYLFLSKRPKQYANLWLGLFLLGLSLLTTEVFLCYSNLMFDVLWLADFSEPANFLVSPLGYLYVQAKLGKPFSWRRQWWHFVPFLLYGAYLSLAFFPQGEAHKFNAYIGAYHPLLPRLEASPYFLPEWAYGPRRWVNELTLAHLVAYVSLVFASLAQAFQEAGLPFLSKRHPDLAWCRGWAFQMLSVVLLFVAVKLRFQHDLGDHILAAHITFVIYLVSFKVMRESVFLHPHEPIQAEPIQAEPIQAEPIQAEPALEEKKKYGRSTVTEEAQADALARLRLLMEEEKPFLQPDFSMPALAKMLRLTPHQLSQMLNDGLQVGFFELAAQYRIAEAKKLLHSHPHHKIEEIAEMVGYLSKSAFNTGFKKLVGLTPSEYRKSANA